MADFLAALGRSKAVTKTTSFFQDLAVSKQALEVSEQQEELNAQKIAENNMILQERKRQKVWENTEMPLEIIANEVASNLLPGTRKGIFDQMVDANLARKDADGKYWGTRAQTKSFRDMKMNDHKWTSEFLIPAQQEGITLELNQRIQAKNTSVKDGGLADSKDPNAIKVNNDRIFELQKSQIEMNWQARFMKAYDAGLKGDVTMESVEKFQETRDEADLDPTKETPAEKEAKEIKKEEREFETFKEKELFKREEGELTAEQKNVEAIQKSRKETSGEDLSYEEAFQIWNSMKGKSKEQWLLNMYSEEINVGGTDEEARVKLLEAAKMWDEVYAK